MRYTLRQLEVFLAAAHTENLTQAASELAMSQSAASGALKELEDRFGTQLFDRIGKRLQLNDFGRAIRPQAESLIAQARELEQALSQHAGAGDLKVGATLTIGNYLAVGIMARYMAAHPGTHVYLDVENTATVARKVANFELDIGMIEGDLTHPDLEFIAWRDDELVVFCAPGHPLAKKKSLDDEDLRAATWLVREAGSGTRQAFDRAMHGLLPHLNLLPELQHTEAIKRAVEAGLGIGCLSRVTLEEAFRRGSLIPLPVPHRDFTRRFYFILHKQKYRSTGVDAWLALCRNHA
ncbi:MAG: LysR substrate-binding domain-containing protein [Gammaproteobacteria bacterium]